MRCGIARCMFTAQECLLLLQQHQQTRCMPTYKLNTDWAHWACIKWWAMANDRLDLSPCNAQTMHCLLYIDYVLKDHVKWVNDRINKITTDELAQMCHLTWSWTISLAVVPRGKRLNSPAGQMRIITSEEVDDPEWSGPLVTSSLHSRMPRKRNVCMSKTCSGQNSVPWCTWCKPLFSWKQTWLFSFNNTNICVQISVYRHICTQ